MHLIRHSAPKGWPISRSERRFTTRPSPGPHKLDQCITLNLLIKEILNQSETTRETKNLLHQGHFLIDKRKVQNHKFPVGIFDIIEMPKLKQAHRVFQKKDGSFITRPIKSEDSSIKPCKVVGKTILKKGKIQLNLFDGKNRLTENKDIKVNDSILLDLEKDKISSHLKFEKGAKVYITDGKYMGNIGIVEEIKEEKNNSRVILKIGKDKVETTTDYAFVIGKMEIPNEK